ncbi:DUF1642 domain-containing protein [Sporosarcina sp. resist]|uniref:DUF1642 domain-containing protein n=1 Tax=Sporosarcina sp. resist TaxID=2762563 RepID=UPI00164E822D|nr:DUF1642 domain-containing protein [Sporosarcina sp. resist]QNK87781.1 DUF1642 domain-containing protein [Sporosarcina sp. resist]
MTEKVKVPRGVDDAIKWAREKGYTDCGIILATQFVPIKFNFEVIARWMVDGENDDRLLDALVNGYEVEPEYKVGDWVVFVDILGASLVGKVEGFNDGGFIRTDIRLDDMPKQWFLAKSLRHATPEEIKVEQERRLWAGIGRGIKEFRIGDTVELTRQLGFKIYLEKQIEVAEKQYELGVVTGVYPGESFISFEECDSNA